MNAIIIQMNVIKFAFMYLLTVDIIYLFKLFFTSVLFQICDNETGALISIKVLAVELKEQKIRKLNKLIDLKTCKKTLKLFPITVLNYKEKSFNAISRFISSARFLIVERERPIYVGRNRNKNDAVANYTHNLYVSL
jgi:hypothetical protein